MFLTLFWIPSPSVAWPHGREEGTLEREAQSLGHKQAARYGDEGAHYDAAAARPLRAGRRGRADLQRRSDDVRHVLHDSALQERPKGTAGLPYGA